MDCEINISSTDCLDKLTTKIEENIISLPKKINGHVETAQALTEEACKGIEEYASNTLSDLESEGGELLSNISECIENIINYIN